jgi:signal transduction histidine kinase
MSLIRSLSGRLLILTIIFVMLAEVLIFVPSLARFREDYLRERLAAANIVAIAMRGHEDDLTRNTDIDYFAVPHGDEYLEARLLRSAQVRSVALSEGVRRMPILRGDWRDPVAETFTLDDDTIFRKIIDGVTVMIRRDPDRVIRVIGTPDVERNPMGETVEITLSEAQLYNAMYDFGLRILKLSLVISLLTAALVFLSLNRWLVRPIRRLIGAMTDFRQSPEAARILDPGMGRTELDEAERELSSMQTEVRAALVQKSRLASLGEAVAKINHDLRNMLASTQLLADRLERSDDPLVQRTAPKLLRSLDRATDLCTRTLTFGSADEPPPVRRRVRLSSLIEEVREAVVVETGGVTFSIDVPGDIYAEADFDQLFRILQNLTRNAEQAMAGTGKGSTISVRAWREGDGVTIDVADDGPGMPKVARENLFKAFRGSVRKGGTGLGLHIARELARGHGGDLTLLDSNDDGTTFRVTIPDTAARSSAL